MRVRPPITELGGLLSALRTLYGSRKSGAEVVIRAEKHEVREHFDDGKGHSGAFSTQFSEVDPVVFEEARKRGFVTGKIEPGFVSTTDFLLTNNERLLSEIHHLADEWDKKEWEKNREEYAQNHPPAESAAKE